MNILAIEARWIIAVAATMLVAAGCGPSQDAPPATPASESTTETNAEASTGSPSEATAEAPRFGGAQLTMPADVIVADPAQGASRSAYFGDLHVQGREGVSFFTRQKVTISRWVETKRRFF